MALQNPQLGTPRGLNEVPSATPLEAIRRNLLLVVLPVVILVGAAVGVGFARSPTYSSNAQLNVGGVNLTVQSIPGYSLAVQQLALSYSRSIDATDVVVPAARQAGVSQAVVESHVTAAPVEGSPLVRILAQSPDPRQAVRLADASADALVAHAASLNRGNPDTPRLLARFIADSNAVRTAQTALARAKGAGARSRAQTEVDVAQLRQRVDSALYQDSQAGGSTTSLVQKLAPASNATSDRSSVLQRYVLAGLIAGLLVGVGLALLREGSSRRRRLTQP